jgi:hypothetical protein
MGSPEHQNRLSKGVTGKIVIPFELTSQRVSRGWKLHSDHWVFSGNEKSHPGKVALAFCFLFLD